MTLDMKTSYVEDKPKYSNILRFELIFFHAGCHKQVYFYLIIPIEINTNGINSFLPTTFMPIYVCYLFFFMQSMLI